MYMLSTACTHWASHTLSSSDSTDRCTTLRFFISLLCTEAWQWVFFFYLANCSNQGKGLKHDFSTGQLWKDEGNMTSVSGLLSERSSLRVATSVSYNATCTSCSSSAAEPLSTQDSPKPSLYCHFFTGAAMQRTYAVLATTVVSAGSV